ncbi:MAG: Flp pilus assembly complex ATPase component TadA [Ignavibacteriales bacterium]|nr:Flp pilus assembly complex ATPase component TadA [Ignavibacteriales bacterium]
MDVKRPKKEFGEILIEKGIITPDILLTALDTLSKETQKNRRKLPQVLVEDFNVDRNKVYQEVADFYAFKTLDVANYTVEDSQLAFIRKQLNDLPVSIRELAVENHVLPFTTDPENPDRLFVITPDPTKSTVHLIARTFDFLKFEIFYVSYDQYEELWKRVNIGRSTYKDKESSLRDESEFAPLEEDSELYEQVLEEEINRSGLVDLVENIFMDAVRVGASDIHVIPRGERSTEFHFRVDGKLSVWYTHTESRAEAVAAVVKDRAMNVDRFERNTAQDGFAQFIIDRKTVRFRVSVIPVVGKELRSKLESIVIRVLQEPKVGSSIDDLGFEPVARESFVKAISKPYGIVIVTGPTGSGKSTTLVAALKTVMDPSVNVITVEDPVEYFIDGARQVKLNPKLDFEGALRAILRHDPDIVMVGEIRDQITANIAVKLANTGHLTFSTLHTNDAPSAISRLYKMEVEPFLLAYSINMILAQRLLRKLCEKCKSPISEPDQEVLKKVGLTEKEIKQSRFYRPIGCKDCLKGYRGRTAIHEALYFTKDIRKVILEADRMVDEERVRNLAIKQGMRTLRQAALELLKQGVTSLEEVASATVEEE